MLWSAAKLEVDDAHVSDLAAKLEPVLAKFTDAETGRFGNGLFLLLGGVSTWAHPTAAEFARTVIAATIHGWAYGEPLRFRVSALLEGADIDQELHLAEGIRVSRLPKSFADLPASLPPLALAAKQTDIIGGAVMSIDCEMSPALYLPARDEAGRLSSPKREFKFLSGRVPNLSLEGFCESVSLAAKGCIDWFVQWREFGPIEAFTDMPSGVTSKVRMWARGTKVSESDLVAALEIH